MLEGYLNIGKSIRFCANELGMNSSSIHGEIKRNSLTSVEYTTGKVKGLWNSKAYVSQAQNKYYYSGNIADFKARRRRLIANQCHCKLTSENTPLSKAIERCLKKHWSPEQIANVLKLGLLHVDGVKQRVKIAVQSIYTWIYSVRKDLQQYLRRNKRYRHNGEYYANKKRRKELQAERGIERRPLVVDKRTRIGDWEGDTVLGNNNGSTGRIITLVERKTGYLLAKILHPLTSEQNRLSDIDKECERLTMSLRFADGTAELFSKQIKGHYLKTLTLDNGSENASFEWIERYVPGLNIYFANPYHSWERGSNENTNGLLRQYFPKGTDFRDITQDDLDRAVNEINNRPRKRLGWKSPKQKMWQNAALKSQKSVAIGIRI